MPELSGHLFPSSRCLLATTGYSRSTPVHQYTTRQPGGQRRSLQYMSSQAGSHNHSLQHRALHTAGRWSSPQPRSLPLPVSTKIPARVVSPHPRRRNQASPPTFRADDGNDPCRAVSPPTRPVWVGLDGELRSRRQTSRDEHGVATVAPSVGHRRRRRTGDGSRVWLCRRYPALGRQFGKYEIVI